MPTVTLSLPLAIGLFILLVAVGAGTVYALAKQTPQIVVPFTPTPTATTTATVTLTVTPSPTGTTAPTATPLPPREYTIKANDTCSSIAYTYGVSVQSIAIENALPPDCGSLVIGRKLRIPQPTVTPTPQPSSTSALSSGATDKNCELFSYTVKENDSLGSISANYRVPGQAIKDYNAMTSDIVQLGQNLKIPLCKRLPTAGPTSTPTPPPPYLAPNLLLPPDGASFVTASDVITLQWSSVGNLRQNESYAVTIEDLTDGTGKKVIDYVTDTKYIVPATLRPTTSTPHIFRWMVFAVRQTGTTKDGQAIYDTGGALSTPRVFSWVGTGSSNAPVATPKP
jgi:LysM repeat protein